MSITRPDSVGKADVPLEVRLSLMIQQPSKFRDSRRGYHKAQSEVDLKSKIMYTRCFPTIFRAFLIVFDSTDFRSLTSLPTTLSRQVRDKYVDLVNRGFISATANPSNY